MAALTGQIIARLTHFVVSNFPIASLQAALLGDSLKTASEPVRIRNRGSMRSGAFAKKTSFSVPLSDYAYVCMYQIRKSTFPSYIPSKNYICLTPAILRGVSQEPQTDIFQNLVRKGNLTWSALDILDFHLHRPGKPNLSCGNLPRSRSLAVELIPHITSSSSSATLP